MPTTIKMTDLRPYQAVLLAQMDADGELMTAKQVMNKLKKVLDVKTGSSARKIVNSGQSVQPDSFFIHYEDRRPASWSLKPVMDRVNYLAVVVVKGRWIAIHCTEGVKRDAIKRAIRKRKLGSLRLVVGGHLKAAFMKGPARTLWMRGTHRSTPWKADTKVLGGKDLAPALDPLGDQSYRYTAARFDANNPAIGDVMGCAVDQSKVWVGPSPDWNEFRSVIVALLDELDATAGEESEPLPVLALAQTDLKNVNSAFDLAVAPPELQMLGPALDLSEVQHLADLETLAFGTQFEVTQSTGHDVAADVFRSGVPIGNVELHLSDSDGEITVEIEGTPATGHTDEFNEVKAKLNDPDLLTIYYDSGHTVQSSQAFTVRYRDLPFLDWTWVAFGDQWQVQVEKPAAGLTAIGTEKSLFDWTCLAWPVGASRDVQGWLACDDRPGETADFLRIDESSSVPTLELIHVKSAKTASKNRGISVGAYEVVSGQAVKNIRHLDAVVAAGELVSGTIPTNLSFAAWENGEPRSRAQFVARLNQLGSNFARRVVIVQPHVRKELVDAVRSNPNHSEAPRMRQLDSLLHGVAANCQSAGAEFVVVGCAD